MLAIVVLMFGAKKLPDLARSSGQALRIFKAEMNAADDKPQPADQSENTDSRNGAKPTD